MIPIEVMIVIFLLHFIADFLLQSTWMSTNKYKDLKALGTHCLLYSLPFLWFGWVYSLLAGLFHFSVDFVTSKITHRLYKNKEYHWFFVVIGLDQAIHMIALTITWVYIVG